MVTLAQMKKNRQSNSDALRAKLEAQAQPRTGGADDRYWKAETDKAGNGYAVLRFLPAGPSDLERNENAAPFVNYYRHMFKTPAGKWFVNNCPTTIGDECPVCKANSELWNTEIPANQDLVRKRKRQQKYVTNVLVVKDSKNPENEGKVFLYEFGTKIFEKIKGIMFPEFEDEDARDPFDLWEGADFKLKIRQVEGYTNYDKSEFEATSTPVADTDEDIERIWKQCHSLLDFVEPSKYKSYDKLQQEFNAAVNGTARTDTAEDDYEAPAPKLKVVKEVEEIASDDDGDERMDFFKAMLDDD